MLQPLQINLRGRQETMILAENVEYVLRDHLVNNIPQLETELQVLVLIKKMEQKAIT